MAEKLNDFFFKWKPKKLTENTKITHPMVWIAKLHSPTIHSSAASFRQCLLCPLKNWKGKEDKLPFWTQIVFFSTVFPFFFRWNNCQDARKVKKTGDSLQFPSNKCLQTIPSNWIKIFLKIVKTHSIRTTEMKILKDYFGNNQLISMLVKIKKR